MLSINTWLFAQQEGRENIFNFLLIYLTFYFSFEQKGTQSPFIIIRKYSWDCENSLKRKWPIMSTTLFSGLDRRLAVDTVAYNKQASTIYLPACCCVYFYLLQHATLFSRQQQLSRIVCRVTGIAAAQPLVAPVERPVKSCIIITKQCDSADTYKGASYPFGETHRGKKIFFLMNTS